jgi:O-antigen/teichoic acid export membrane protein
VKELIQKIVRSEYAKNILRVVTGTGIAQVINFLFNIYIAKIYLPNDFGKFSLFMNIVSLALIFSCFKLDVELVKVEEKDVKKTMKDAFLITIATSIFFGLIFGVMYYLNFLNLKQYHFWWLIFFPIIIFLLTSVQIQLMYLVRLKLFNFQSKYRVAEALSVNVMYVVFAFMKDFGLLIANVISLIFDNIFLIIGLKKSGKLVLSWKFEKINLARILKILKFQQFYMYQSLLEVLQVTLIPFFMSSQLEVIGYYALSTRVLQAPMRFLSLPLAQVFYSEIAERKRNGISLLPLYKKTLWISVMIGIPILLAIILFGPFLFELVFGKNWTMAGHFAQILVLWFVVDFIKGPMIQVMYLFNQQKLVSRIMFASVLVMFLILLISKIYSEMSVFHVFMMISVSQAFFLLLIIYSSYKGVKKYDIVKE